MNVFQINPRTANAIVAKWALGHWDADLVAAKQRKQLSDDVRNATLSVLVRANPDLEADLQLLSAASDASGYDDTKIEVLQTIQLQFWQALAPEVRAAVPRPGGPKPA